MKINSVVFQPIRKLRRALSERNAWLLLREQRIAELERQLQRTQARVSERDDWLLLRERRIVQLETEIERAQEVVRDRERMISLLEVEVQQLKTLGPDATLQSELERRNALIQLREARIRSLEIENQVQDAELHLLRSALEQAENVLRRRDARLLLLDTQPERVRPLTQGGVCDFRVDDGTPAAVIEEWQRAASNFVNLGLSGDQKLIDPYILEINLHGHPTRILIATREGQRWYDKFNLTDGAFIDALQMIGQGQTVFDCGAHHGVSALLYSKMVGPSGSVMAFEPYPMNIKIAELNARLNNRKNINFANLALSSEIGQAQVSLLEQCIVLENKDADDTVSVDLAPLDQFAHLRPDFIKIDVEGAEIDALQGAREILGQKPALYIEIHANFLPRFNKSPMQVFDFIRLEDYFCFINYPDKEPLLKYELEFQLVQPCAIFFVPKNRPPVLRYYTPHRAINR